jgi:hypothetical protein
MEISHFFIGEKSPESKGKKMACEIYQRRGGNDFF